MVSGLFRTSIWTDSGSRPHENGFSSVAAVGFALTSYAVGVERGWLSRASAVERTLTTLRFFDRAPQSDHRSNTTGYRGLYYHFIDPEDGFRYRQVELSTIDTALLMAGVLFAGEYYQSSDPEEQEIRQLAERLYRRVDWQWMQQDQGLIGHGWKPESGSLQHGYGGYNEAMLLYVLALGSPTYPVTENAWDQFMSTCQWGSFQGQDFVQFSPLFGHQYSHVWIDFRQITDDYMREKGVDWFENARRATLAQASYGRENPQKWRDYGKYVWGWTACDGPFMGPSPISARNVDFGPTWLGEFRPWSSVTTEPWLLPLRVGACPLPRIGSSPLLSI